MAEKTDFRKIYSELEKKHHLPDFSSLHNEFEISRIEEEKFAMREIRRKIHDKIDAVCKNLESILQPEATLQNMYEAGAFSDDEKKKIYLLYKELMSAQRQSMLLEVECSNELDAKFIKEFTARWKKAKAELSGIFKRLEESWTKESDFEEKLGYFG